MRKFIPEVGGWTIAAGCAASLKMTLVGLEPASFGSEDVAQGDRSGNWARDLPDPNRESYH